MTRNKSLITLIALIAFAPLTQAKFRMPEEVPVDRLITNVTAYVKEHPKEAQGYYTLGRLNYLALSLKSKTVRTYEKGDATTLPGVPNFFQQAGKEQPTEAELKSHLSAAAENFQKALQLDDKNALYHLGMASLMDAAVNSGLELGAVPAPDGQRPPPAKTPGEMPPSTNTPSLTNSPSTKIPRSKIAPSTASMNSSATKPPPATPKSSNPIPPQPNPKN